MTTRREESLARSAVYEFLLLGFLYPAEGAIAVVRVPLEKGAACRFRARLSSAISLRSASLTAVNLSTWSWEADHCSWRLTNAPGGWQSKPAGRLGPRRSGLLEEA